MNNQTSIKYISALLEKPGTLTDGDQSSIALFRQTFPYFVPGRYLVALEAHKKSPYTPQMLTAIQPYLGDWIMFCDFLDGSKKAINETMPLNKVVDKKKVDIHPPQPTPEVVVPKAEPLIAATPLVAPEVIVPKEEIKLVQPEVVIPAAVVPEAPVAKEEFIPAVELPVPEAAAPIIETQLGEPDIIYPEVITAKDEPFIHDMPVAFVIEPPVPAPVAEPEPAPPVPQEVHVPVLTPVAYDTPLPSIPLAPMPVVIEEMPEEIVHAELLDRTPEVVQIVATVAEPVLVEMPEPTVPDPVVVNETVFPADPEVIATEEYKEVADKSDFAKAWAEKEAQDAVPEVVAPVNDDAVEIVNESVTNTETTDAEQDPLIFPIYTRDYFLQQGEKVSEEIPLEINELKDIDPMSEEDKSLMVVMSFSEWLLHFKNTAEKQKEESKDQKALKTMWQKEKLAAAMEEENEEIPETVFEMAVNSISKEEGLVSDTLAEIYIKQGKYDKAIEMYRKLSLRNPQKSAYFARKIEEALKDKQS